MIREAKGTNYDEVYEAADKNICCGHDKFFWDEFKKADFGDVILCGRCHQYFGILNALPWVCGPNSEWGIFHHNHLKDKFCFPVKVRVSRTGWEEMVRKKNRMGRDTA